MGETVTRIVVTGTSPEILFVLLLQVVRIVNKCLTLSMMEIGQKKPLVTVPARIG
jgi:hypothetical protein